jgi:hypothetical protein
MRTRKFHNASACIAGWEDFSDIFFDIVEIVGLQREKSSFKYCAVPFWESFGTAKGSALKKGSSFLVENVAGAFGRLDSGDSVRKRFDLQLQSKFKSCFISVISIGRNRPNMPDLYLWSIWRGA